MPRAVASVRPRDREETLDVINNILENQNYNSEEKEFLIVQYDKEISIRSTLHENNRLLTRYLLEKVFKLDLNDEENSDINYVIDCNNNFENPYLSIKNIRVNIKFNPKKFIELINNDKCLSFDVFEYSSYIKKLNLVYDLRDLNSI